MSKSLDKNSKNIPNEHQSQISHDFHRVSSFQSRKYFVNFQAAKKCALATSDDEEHNFTSESTPRS